MQNNVDLQKIMNNIESVIMGVIGSTTNINNNHDNDRIFHVINIISIIALIICLREFDPMILCFALSLMFLIVSYGMSLSTIISIIMISVGVWSIDRDMRTLWKIPVVSFACYYAVCASNDFKC